VEHLADVVGFPFTGDGEVIVLDFDLEVVAGEPGESHRDAVLVLADLDGVKRRPVVLLRSACGRFEQVENVIETDAGSMNSTHCHILLEATWK